ncbi:MAG: PadR family transcriptional regulator [Steroidobacteraceae bacterium]
MDPDTNPDASDTERSDQERLSHKFQRELNAGLVGLVLLAVLDRADEDLYGYQIAKRLQDLADGSPPVKQGALYPVLRQLSSNGLLASRIVPSYAGPPRRYYRITDAGRATLAEWRDIWRNTRDFVDGFMNSNGAAS